VGFARHGRPHVTRYKRRRPPRLAQREKREQQSSGREKERAFLARPFQPFKRALLPVSGLSRGSRGLQALFCLFQGRDGGLRGPEGRLEGDELDERRQGGKGTGQKQMMSKSGHMTREGVTSRRKWREKIAF